MSGRLPGLTIVGPSSMPWQALRGRSSRFVYLDLPRWVLWLKRKRLLPVAALLCALAGRGGATRQAISARISTSCIT